MPAETSIQRARRLAKEKREKGEAEETAAAAKKAKADKPKKAELGLLDRIRAAFSSQDDIDRINRAVSAMESGIDDANKRKK